MVRRRGCDLCDVPHTGQGMPSLKRGSPTWPCLGPGRERLLVSPEVADRSSAPGAMAGGYDSG
jgi:hypothetical protein